MGKANDILSKINNSSDDLNPKYIFRLTDNKLLEMIVNKKIDIIKIAKEELAGRGYKIDNKKR